MGNARYIGRVGGLAVALGVGMAVATTPGVAWADDTGSVGSADTTGSAGTAGTTGTSEPGTTTATTTGATGTSTVGDSQTDGAAPDSGVVDASPSRTSASDASVRQVPSGVVLVTGGADLSSKSSSEPPATGDVGAESTLDDSTPPKRVADSAATQPEAPATAKAPVSGPRGGADKRRRPVDEPTGTPGVDANTVTATAGAPPSRPQPAQGAGTPAGDAPDQRTAQQPAATTVSGSSVPLTRSVAAQATPVAAAAQMTAPTTTTSPVSSVVADTLAWAGLSPSVTDSPVAPFESPAMLVILAGWRRQSQQALAGEKTDQNVADPQTSQTVDPMVTGDLNATGDQGDRQALADTSTMQLSAPVTVTAAEVTAAPSASAQMKAAPQTKPDNVKPTVAITAPANNATVSGTVTLTATASDNVGVTKVQFMDGTQLLAEDPSSPYSLSWNTTPADNGSHTLTAKAWDAAGNTTISAPVSITVNNGTTDTTAPAVSLTAPANNATVSGTLTLTANASDNVGVTKVQFLVNGTQLLGEDPSSPYSLSVVTTPADNGTYTLAAKAWDAAGNTTISAPVSITVNNGTTDTTAPAVSLTAPANNATVSGTVTLTATASDNVGVTRVQFMDGTQLLAEDPSSPYSLSWNTTTAANGSHTLTAQAWDAAGKTTISAPVSVTVANAAPSALSGTTTSANTGSDPNGVAVVGNRAYTANGASDTVSVIDVNTKQIVATIPVDHTPTYVVAKPDGTRVYVSNANSATVSVIGTTTNSVIKSVGVYGGAYAQIPGGLAISPDGTKLYVSTFDGTVSLIDTTTNTWNGLKFIRPGITNMEVSADGNRLYIADTQRGVILAVDTAKLVGPTSGIPGIPEIGIGYGTTPVDVAVSQDGKWLYSVNAIQGSTGSSVSVIDADPTSATFNRVVRTLSVGDTAAFVALSPDGSRAYVTHQVPGKVTVIDTRLNVVLGTVPTDNDMVASDAYVAVGSDGRVYVTDSDDNRLHITTVSGGTPPILPVTVTPISVSTTPTGVAVSGNQAYAYGNGTVSVINTATKQVTGTTAVYSEPSAVSPDGTRRYAVNGRSVSVVNTATNAVIANIDIPVCNDCYYYPSGLYGVVVNPNGTRVYVSEHYFTESGGTTVVSVIDATNNTLIGAGYPPLLNDLDATPDGRLYAADMTYPAVYAFDANMNGTGGVYVAPAGTSYAFVDTLAVSADGKRTYAVVSSWDVGFYHVSVIDSDPASATYNRELAQIRTQDTAVSPNGSRTYVMAPDGKTITVIDTASNSVIGTFTTDLTSVSTTRSIAVAPDGTLYISDSADNKVYAVTVGNPTML